VPRTLPVAIASLPEFGDHRIAGKVIVPAVYLLDAMVRAATEAGLIEHAPLTMHAATLPRFLPADEIERCAFELASELAGGSTRLRLSSRITLPNGIQRTRDHVILTLADAPTLPAPPEIVGEFAVSAERLYRELIPFGPRYCNLRDTLRLGPGGALGTVRSPEPGFETPSLAGCPYLFDSAMHLACLWGQRYAGVVAYPTGFAFRTILAPIAHGERLCVVAPRSKDPRALRFDVWLLDEDRRPCDVTLGLSMAPILAGSTPPRWIVDPDRPRSP
jgi:hypothetical protein